MYKEVKIKFDLSRIITENGKHFANDILLPRNYFHQSYKKKKKSYNSCRRLKRTIASHNLSRPGKAALWKVTEVREEGWKTAINLKWNLNLVKKRVFPTKESRRSCVDIIVRKLSLSILRRVIVRLTKARSLRNHPGALRTTIIFTLQPHKGGRGIHRSRN